MIYINLQGSDRHLGLFELELDKSPRTVCTAQVKEPKVSLANTAELLS